MLWVRLMPLLVCLGFVLPGWSQETVETSRLRTLRAELEPPKPLIVLSNAALGSLEQMRRHPVPATFTVGTDQALLYTDNAFWSRDTRQASLGWMGWFWANWVPYSTRRWTPRVGVEYDLYRYRQASEADFNSQAAFVSSRLYLDAHNRWSWNLQYSFWRFDERQGENDFAQQGWLQNSLTWTRPLGQDGVWHFLGSYQFGWRHTRPREFDRIENTLVLSLLYYPIQTISLQPYIFCEGFVYPNNTDVQRHRRDFRLTPGVSLEWNPAKHLIFTGEFVWLRNYSNNVRRNYEVLLPTLAVQASVGF